MCSLLLLVLLLVLLLLAFRLLVLVLLGLGLLLVFGALGHILFGARLRVRHRCLLLSFARRRLGRRGCSGLGGGSRFLLTPREPGENVFKISQGVDEPGFHCAC